jgi:excinuclease ABC subunit C
VLRDKLAAMERVIMLKSGEQAAISTVQEDLDVLGVYSSENESAVQLVIMRGGKVVGSESFLLEGSEEESAGSVLGSFISQFYVNAVMLPRAIVVRELPQEAESLEIQ